MFREKYIRDNELIKPNDAFLERLKESVQSDEVVQIGDYIDLDNVISMHEHKHEEPLSTQSMKTAKRTWKNVAAIAACLSVVCMLAVTVGGTDWLENRQVLQAGVQAALEETGIEDSASLPSEEETDQLHQAYVEKYKQAYQLFQNSNVVMYQVDDFSECDNGIAFLRGEKEKQRVVESDLRDAVVNDILAEKYTLVESMDNFTNTQFYVAVFANDSCVCFAVDAEQYLYIESVSGIQSLACNK